VTPPGGEPLTVADAIHFPAIQLFVERASTAHQGFELNESNVKMPSFSNPQSLW
jgi:predicted ATPase